MKLNTILIAAVIFVVSGCASTPPPQWSPTTESSESEYLPYLADGSSTISGQAFLTQQGGGVVKAAGREVTLDPATSTGTEWWVRAGKLWVHRFVLPTSQNFIKARRKVTADADGRFIFENLPAGKYYVRTEVTWKLSDYNIQGGLVGKLVEVKEKSKSDVILSSYPE